MPHASQPEPDSLRVDKWLWCVRLCKTRADAARLAERGRVRINSRKISRPSALVRVDDVLTIAMRGRVSVWRVTGLPRRRVSAREAALLRSEIREDGE